jgi:D-methionine transport system substrate-binding protein
MLHSRRHWLAAALLVSIATPSIVLAQAARKELVIGATAGPYSEQVKLGIKPILEKKGYTVRIVEFNDYVQPNRALADGALDANVFQHVVYLNKFASDNNLPLVDLLRVPTAPMGLYSHKHKRLDEVKEGATVALPNDPTNAARALVMLQQFGWVRFKDGLDPLRASERDIEVNVKKIKFIALEAAQLPRSLDDTDFSFVNGNFALSSGLKLSEALALEQISPTYQNIVAVRIADKDKPWIKDLADAYRSREFLAVTKKDFPGFLETDYQQALEAGK